MAIASGTGDAQIQLYPVPHGNTDAVQHGELMAVGCVHAASVHAAGPAASARGAARGRLAQSFAFRLRRFRRLAPDDQPQRQRRQACLSLAGVAGVDDDLMWRVVDRQTPQIFEQIEPRAVRQMQRQGFPAQPDDEVGEPVALPKERAQVPEASVIAVGDAHLAGHRRAATQPLGAMAVGQLQMRKPTSAQVIDTMHPPVGAFAAWLADRGAVGDAQDASRPGGAAPHPARGRCPLDSRQGLAIGTPHLGWV